MSNEEMSKVIESIHDANFRLGFRLVICLCLTVLLSRALLSLSLDGDLIGWLGVFILAITTGVFYGTTLERVVNIIICFKQLPR